LKNKSAFTMIELVFVIVVLGILASLAMGRMDRDLKQEASEQILSDIRLTQQLALRDNKHMPFDGTASDNIWQRAYWKIDFDLTNDYRYYIASDIDLNGVISKTESAIDSTDGKYIYNDLSTDTTMSQKVLLEKKFAINNIIGSTECPIKNNMISISFDYLGRPYSNIANNISANFSNIMTSDCNLTFIMSTDEDNNGVDDQFIITIEAETGHSFIYDQNQS